MQAQETVFITLLGPTNVGKEKFALVYCTGKFWETYKPQATEGSRKLVQLRNINLMVEFYDAMDPRNRPTLLLDCAAYLLIYAINSKASFQQMENIHQTILKNTNHQRVVPTILIGNKCDLEAHREVKITEGFELSKKKGWEFYETSAKYGANIASVVTNILENGLLNIDEHDRKGYEHKKCVIC